MERYYYLLLLFGGLLIPLMRSFEPRIRFRSRWTALFSGVLVMMLVFVPWDIIFTEHAIWSFSHRYVVGVFVLGLPLEEWLFFIVIPYCIVFTYEVLRYFFPRIVFPVTARWGAIVLGIALLALALFNTHRTYTFVVMHFTGVLVLVQAYLGSHRTWLSHFFLTYLVMLFPFLIINGALTGMFTPEPVVSYNDMENLGIRIFTIPVEDAVYLLGMMLVVQMVYEWHKRTS